MSKGSTILITGGTGLIGSALARMLTEKEYRVIILTRKIPDGLKPQQTNKESEILVEYAEWNIERGFIDESAIQRADHIIHLAGASVAGKRWNKARKKEIVESRTLTSSLIVNALQSIQNKVKTVVSASAIGWYGADRPDKRPFVEEDPPDAGFLGVTCKAWENSIEPVKRLGKRLVKLRLGIVLSNRGGALSEFRKPLNVGVASILGSGKQTVSWIHIADVCRMFCYAIEHSHMQGAYNAVAPHPTTNKNLVLELAKKSRGNFYVPVYVPGFALKLILGEMSIEVLKSTTASNQKIRQAGFRYLYPSLESCIANLSTELKV